MSQNASQGRHSSQSKTAGPSRAYKACLHCRKRKSRCDLEEHEGPPCRRCRHEMRECIIPEERAWPKEEISNSAKRHAGRTETTIKSSKKARVAEGANEAHERPDLVDAVVQTVVASGNDALGLLFQAANSPPNDDEAHSSDSIRDANAQGSSGRRSPIPGQCPTRYHRPVVLSTISDMAYQTWSASRFVKMGWLVPAEAVTYLDLFFQNMAAMSPVDLSAYTGNDGHFELVTKEPLLCCAILMISSRYHILPGTAGISRGHFIHERFWRHCQHLIMRLVFGQEKGSSAKTRTLGSIEGLILMSEWNPRALHFPPEADGWDSDLLLTPSAPRPSEYTQARSIIDVIEPARRSDRMSWMLLGCALSLAHELGVFDDDEDGLESVASLPPKKMQAARLRSLLYVFINQLAARQGSTSMLSQQHPAMLANDFNTSGMPSHGAFLQAWTELVKLFKSFSDMAFPSKSATRRLLRSGRYISIMELFQPRLVEWAERYIDSPNIAKEMQDHLFIEHRFTQIYFSSLGMQAECERVSTGGPRTTGTLVDNEHAQQVISHSCSLLSKVVELSERGILRFAPVRIFLHITTASIFLLKALALGVRNSQLREALTVLDRTVIALGTSVPDDIHLAHTYASLLQTHIGRLRRAFSETLSSQQVQTRLQTPVPGSEEVNEQLAENEWIGNNDMSPSSFSDWFALPFDPTMAPLFPVGLGDADASQTPLSFDGDNLAFLWNFQALG